MVPDGPQMRERPTLVLVHGGPASYDHSYFKPHFSPLTDVAQLVYLDLRDHGRSARGDPRSSRAPATSRGSTARIDIGPWSPASWRSALGA